MKALIIPSLLALTASAHAAITVAFSNQVGAGGTTTFTPTYVVSSTDLINGATPTAFAPSSAAFELESSGGLAQLTNGTYGSINSGDTGSHPSFATVGNNGGTSVTYSLGSNPAGYNITNINVFGGWNDNGRDQTAFTVLIALASSPTVFTTLTTQSFNPSVATGLQSATQVAVSDTTGFLATGVANIRFTFPTVENGYTGLAEIDVIGSAVPEPGSAMLAGLAAVFGLARRRRTAR